MAISSKHQSADSYVLPACGTGDFSFDRIFISTVLFHLSTLDVSKSTGPNGLSAAFLSEVANEIAVPLTNLYNQSLHDRFIPVGWKQSYITPVYKGGKCDDPSNYRPILVVPILAKVLEKFVSVQLIQYLENNLLHPHQGAFRCGKSTEDILLLTVDHIVNTLGVGKSVCAAFLDLKKAFDSSDHCTLLQRIGNLGVVGSVLRWFKNYLSGRVHRVKLHNQFSEWREMKGGILQGSALGPLLFVIYMNNLPLQITDGLLVQYADDTTLVCSGSTPSAAAAVLNSQLKLVHNWIRNSKMSLNHSKSSVM